MTGEMAKQRVSVRNKERHIEREAEIELGDSIMYYVALMIVSPIVNWLLYNWGDNSKTGPSVFFVLRYVVVDVMNQQSGNFEENVRCRFYNREG